MTTGERIKTVRKLKGLTQKELAFMVGLPDVRIRQYETNIRTPKIDLLQKFAEALEVPVATLKGIKINGEDEAEELLNDIVEKFGKDFVIKIINKME